MELRIRPRKNKASEALARFHRVVCDQPFAEGGNDTGMTPPELMLAALGCCAMHYGAEYLRARNLPPDNIQLSVSAEKGGKPMRLVEIAIQVDAPTLSTRHREGLIKAVETCLLHRTLTNPPKVKLTLTPQVAEGTPDTKHLQTSPPASG